jgi:PAS domain S-box-containing protein
MMTILLVENSGESYEQPIQSSGYDATICRDAETAVEACQVSFYPLIVVDLGLPELNITAFCRRIRALPQGDRSMILAMSRRDRPNQLQAAMEAGADEYLLTPLSEEQVRVRFMIIERQLEQLARSKRTEELLSKTLEELQYADEELRMQNEELLASNDELRQIQQDLETLRQTYADLYNFAPIGYCMLDEYGTVLEANLTAARLLGRERSRLLKARFYHFIVEDDRERFFLHLKTVGQEHSHQTCELRLLRQDGSEFSAQLNTASTPEDAQHGVHYRTAISDITARKRLEAELQSYRQHLEELVEQRTHELENSTEHLHQEMSGRKRAAQALRTSEQQYRLLAENVADGIGIIQDGKLAFVNDALAAMLGYTARQLMEMEAIDLVHEAYKDSFKKRLQKLMDDGMVRDWQAVYLARDGREVWTKSHYQVIEWEGKPAFLATVRDITSRKLRERAIEKERAHLQQENVQLRCAIEDRSRFGEMIGKSPAMQTVYAQIVTAAAVDANVLISGESGTGKELAARTIHRLSRRKTQEFVAVNCGAIPENLFEREFFGHHKGAFTGAEKDSPGLFDRAHKGTLFLDEVGELPAAMQVKLLRVLETGEYTPVGQNRPRQVDVRLVAATNKNLEALVKQGLMRDDFFYRIYVLVISMPPLRQHPEDIPLLIAHFLHQHDDATPEPPPTIPEPIIETLSQQQWPGNVRELYNVLQRYLQEDRLALSDILRTEPRQSDAAAESECILNGLTFREAVEAYEKRLIVTALQQHHNNTANTAKGLRMPLRTLYRKIQKYQLL